MKYVFSWTVLVVLMAGARYETFSAADTLDVWTLSREAREAFAMHLRSDAGASFLVWPQSCEKKWSASEIPEVSRKEALVWIRKVLRDDVLPPDLAERLVGMRVSVHPKPPKDVDEILARYEYNGVRIQVSEAQRGMAILVEPLDQRPQAAMGWLDAQQHVMKVYGRAFKMPRIPLQHVSVYLQKYGDETPMYCGVLKLDPNKDHWIGTDNSLHFGRAPDALRYWHDEISVVTDGPKVGFIFSKLDAEPDEMFTKPRPSPPSGTRW
jgi:hypothetical protein